MKKSTMAILIGFGFSIMTTAAHAQISTRPATTLTVFATKAADKMIALVNVNRASATQLETLPNVGPKIAVEIIKNRPYKDGKDLQTKVKSIGPKTWAKIKKFVLFR